MRRLAIFSVGFSGAVFLAGYLLDSGNLSFAALICLAAFALIFVLLAEGKKLRSVLCIALAGALFAFLWTACWTNLFFAKAEEVAGTTVQLEAVVADWPQETQYGYSVLVDAKLGRNSVSTLLYMDGQAMALQPGDHIHIVTHIILADRTFSGAEITYYMAKGIFLRGQCYGELTYERPENVPFRYRPAILSQRLKNLITEIFDEDISPLAEAIVVGNRSNLSDIYTSSLQRTGLSHTVAVSGMHMSFLAGLISLLLGKNHRRTSLVIIPVVLLFMTVAGNTPSVVRASAMIILLYAAPLFGREGDSLTSLAFALMLILLINPLAVTHIGLQLSFASVAGILLVSDRLQTKVMEGVSPWFAANEQPVWRAVRSCLHAVVSVISATVGALIFTTPLVAYYFGMVSIISPITNLFTLWAVSLVFTGVLVTATVGTFFPAAAAILAIPVTLVARYLNWIVPQMARIPFAALQMDSFFYCGWLIFLYVLLGCACVLPGRRKWAVCTVAAVGVFLLATGLNNSSFHLGAMTVAVLDVGQGQSVLLSTEGKYILIDCGGTAQAGDVAANALQNIGVNQLDYLVLTHCHADHADGVEQLMTRISVSELVLPEYDDQSELRRSILKMADQLDISTTYVAEDTIFSIGGNAIMTVFAPLGDGGTNEIGIIPLCTNGELDVLVTGDAGSEVERRLAEHTQLPEIELMLAGHHGSSTSNSELLFSVIKPKIVAISVGADNQFGHPHDAALWNMEESCAAIYRTDQAGTITVHLK